MGAITPETRAHYVLETYLREVGNQSAASAQELLRRLIAEAIRKAVTDERVAIRENMPCHSDEPCAFESICAHHKALAGAILGQTMDASAA